jgi:hypothetical protein
MVPHATVGRSKFQSSGVQFLLFDAAQVGGFEHNCNTIDDGLGEFVLTPLCSFRSFLVLLFSVRFCPWPFYLPLDHPSSQLPMPRWFHQLVDDSRWTTPTLGHRLHSLLFEKDQMPLHGRVCQRWGGRCIVVPKVCQHQAGLRVQRWCRRRQTRQVCVGRWVCGRVVHGL